ncbi:MAG: hypothetical protein ABSF74_06295 [Dehalococcoidia bacterium]|jgi:hypothetical protein
MSNRKEAFLTEYDTVLSIPFSPHTKWDKWMRKPIISLANCLEFLPAFCTMGILSVQGYINCQASKTHDLTLPKSKIVKDPNGDIWGLNGDNVSSGIHISKWKLKKPKYIVFFQRAIGDDFQHMGCHKSLYSAMKQATQLYYDNPELCLANIREANMKLYTINQDIAEPPSPLERGVLFF